MKELDAYGKYFTTFLTSLPKPTVILPAFALSFTINNYHLMVLLLLFLFAADYFTGVLASWVQWKKVNKEGSFFRGENAGFSSDRWRLTLVKAITYFLFVISSKCIEFIFMIKPFAVSWIDHEITMTFIGLAISCAIEIYSIFWENLPKAGFSIWGKVKKIISQIKEIKNTTKDLTNGDNSTT
jgi:hypothetical protein